MSLHLRTHAEPVPGCFGCKALTLTVAASSTPSRGDGSRSAQIIAAEAQMDLDRPAYKRLRAQGLQPKAVEGSHLLEQRASDRVEVETGHLFSKEQFPAVREAVARMADVKPMRAGDP